MPQRPDENILGYSRRLEVELAAAYLRIAELEGRLGDLAVSEDGLVRRIDLADAQLADREKRLGEAAGLLQIDKSIFEELDRLHPQLKCYCHICQSSRGIEPCDMGVQQIKNIKNFLTPTSAHELCIRCGKAPATHCTPEGICDGCWVEEGFGKATPERYEHHTYIRFDERGMKEDVVLVRREDLDYAIRFIDMHSPSFPDEVFNRLKAAL